MKISLRQSGRAQIAKLSGEVGLEEGAELQTRLLAAIDKDTPHLILELSDLAFIGSPGLSALLASRATARELGGSIQIVSPSEQIGGLLKVTQIDPLIRVHQNLESAIQATIDRPK